MSFKRAVRANKIWEEMGLKMNSLLNRNFISTAPLSTSVKDSSGLVACAENQYEDGIRV